MKLRAFSSTEPAALLASPCHSRPVLRRPHPHGSRRLAGGRRKVWNVRFPGRRLSQTTPAFRSDAAVPPSMSAWPLSPRARAQVANLLPSFAPRRSIIRIRGGMLRPLQGERTAAIGSGYAASIDRIWVCSDLRRLVSPARSGPSDISLSGMLGSRGLHTPEVGSLNLLETTDESPSLTLPYTIGTRYRKKDALLSGMDFAP